MSSSGHIVNTSLWAGPNKHTTMYGTHKKHGQVTTHIPPCGTHDKKFGWWVPPRKCLPDMGFIIHIPPWIDATSHTHTSHGWSPLFRLRLTTNIFMAGSDHHQAPPCIGSSIHKSQWVSPTLQHFHKWKLCFFERLTSGNY